MWYQVVCTTVPVRDTELFVCVCVCVCVCVVPDYVCLLYVTLSDLLCVVPSCVYVVPSCLLVVPSRMDVVVPSCSYGCGTELSE